MEHLTVRWSKTETTYVVGTNIEDARENLGRGLGTADDLTEAYSVKRSAEDPGWYAPGSPIPTYHIFKVQETLTIETVEDET